MDWTRTIQLLGNDAFRRLQEARVILFGVGGVGGWCAEALVRTGIRHLTIVDFDTVSGSNINRQVVATAANIGSPKADEMGRRLLTINPEADITALHQRYSADTAQEFHLEQYDYIIDAIDDTDAKLHLILTATALPRPVFVSSMSAGRKTDTEPIRISDFRKVAGCPLARSLRQRMKKNGTFPQRPFQCVWSPEMPGSPTGTQQPEKKQPIGSIAPIVGIFGMKLANLVIRDITHK